MIDPFGRHISYLRISVTDRCDFRCVYCMSEHMTFLPKAEILSLEEIERLAMAFVRKGVERLRITGGEPLVRRGVISLFDRLGAQIGKSNLKEVTLTTNGSQLARHARDLVNAGVKRVNVSLDTRDADKFRRITRWGELGKVLDGIDAADVAGLKIKINTVALRGVNEDEIEDLMLWAHGRGFDFTLIETMPMGEIDGDRVEQYLPLSLVRARLARSYHAGRERPPHGRPCPLCAGRRDGRAAGLHHAADAQFLRELQPCAADLHRHAVHVPGAGGRRRPASAAARLGGRRAAGARNRRGHRAQAEGT